MKRRAVIFDFEGTLVDFQWRLAPAEAELRAAFAAFGFDDEEFARGNYARMWNAAVDRLAPQGGIAELRAALFPIYDRWDADALTRWAPRPGATALLERLAGAGVRAGMVSNVGGAALDAALQRFGLARCLSPVLSRDQITHMKPRPEGILRVIEHWCSPPEQVLFVGDSMADVLGARAAGLAVAIIRGGECGEADFAAAPPDHWVSDLAELGELIAWA